MKAFILRNYGMPMSALNLEKVERPIPKNNEVLVKIYTTTINDYDWSFITGKPYLYRLMFGLFKPKRSIPGMELAGVIEATGNAARKFKVGDAVFGDISNYGFGSFAEFICVNENALVAKPKKIGFVEASAVPHAMALAWQSLHTLGNIDYNQRILINGGGGGVGTSAIQMAKIYNCDVTGVDSSDKLKMMRSMGYDHVIDYKKTDFTKNGKQYDLILDCKTNESAFSYLRSLKPRGKYITIGGTPLRLLKLFFWSKILPLFSTKKLKILALKPNKDLDSICKLIEEGKIKSEIEGPYPFSDVPSLVEHFGKGQHKGKIVIKVNSEF